MPYEEPTFNRAVDTVLKDAEFEKRLLAIGWCNAQGARTPARVAEHARRARALGRDRPRSRRDSAVIEPVTGRTTEGLSLAREAAAKWRAHRRSGRKDFVC